MLTDRNYKIQKPRNNLILQKKIFLVANLRVKTNINMCNSSNLREKIVHYLRTLECKGEKSTLIAKINGLSNKIT